MNRPIGLTSIVKRVDNLASCDLEGETVLLSLDRGKYYGLDLVGSHIWSLLEQTRTVAELCSVLVMEFDVDKHRCEREALAFLRELAGEKLIEVVDEQTA